jgi:hypothetical protein
MRGEDPCCYTRTVTYDVAKYKFAVRQMSQAHMMRHVRLPLRWKLIELGFWHCDSYPPSWVCIYYDCRQWGNGRQPPLQVMSSNLAAKSAIGSSGPWAKHLAQISSPHFIGLIPVLSLESQPVLDQHPSRGSDATSHLILLLLRIPYFEVPSLRDIITWTLVVFGICLPLSKFT